MLQNVSTSELKEQMQSGLSQHEIEQEYLCNALAALPEDSPGAEVSRLLGTVFPDQGCFAVPPKESEAFEKRVEKLLRVLTQSVHNRYFETIVLNGPLIGALMVSMLAHRDSISKVNYLMRMMSCYECINVCARTATGVSGASLGGHDSQLLPKCCRKWSQELQVSNG